MSTEREQDRRTLYRDVLAELVARYPYAINRHDLELDASRRDVAAAIVWLSNRGLVEADGVMVWSTLAAAEAATLAPASTLTVDVVARRLEDFGHASIHWTGHELARVALGLPFREDLA